MKVIGTMNGWKDAPHCWRHFLLTPFWVSEYVRVGRERVVQVDVLGFVIFLHLAA